MSDPPSLAFNRMHFDIDVYTVHILYALHMGNLATYPQQLRPASRGQLRPTPPLLLPRKVFQADPHPTPKLNLGIRPSLYSERGFGRAFFFSIQPLTVEEKPQTSPDLVALYRSHVFGRSNSTSFTRIYTIIYRKFVCFEFKHGSYRSLYLLSIWSCLNRIVLLTIYYIRSASTP